MTAVDALQECLAAEHAAVYGYGVLGGVLAGVTPVGSSEQQRAASAYVEHRRRRDELTSLITGRGSEPVAAEAAYDVPRQVQTVQDCRDLARLIEDRCAQTYADAVSRTTDRDRELTAGALTACTLTAVGWGAPIEPFPGVAEI
ncbi:MAG TPA: ferritin-like domain-containing protein [Nocardioidaceae bacterium]|jgi:hypothetical protein